MMKAPRKIDKDLAEIYYNVGDSNALSSAQLLFEKAKADLPYKVTLKDIKQFLTRQQAYTIHKKVISRKFPRRRIRIQTIFSRWDADLLDLQDLAQWNDQNKYILVVIDAFSKYLWLRALKNKKSELVKDAMTSVLDEAKNSPISLYTDQGTEFLGAPFQQLLKKKSIQHKLCTGEEFHCPFVERVIRTVKTKLFTWLSYIRSKRWVDDLQKIASSYNKTMHSVTMMRPEEVNEQNNIQTYMNMYYRGRSSKRVKKTKPKFKVGDYVRLLKPKGPFNKGYLPQYTWEIFQISHIVPGDPPAYNVKDLNNEPIMNALFYEPELSLVDKSQLKESYPIRQVLARKTNKDGEKMLKVWWQGFPKSQASWIKASDMISTNTTSSL